MWKGVGIPQNCINESHPLYSYAHKYSSQLNQRQSKPLERQKSLSNAAIPLSILSQSISSQPQQRKGPQQSNSIQTSRAAAPSPGQLHSTTCQAAAGSPLDQPFESIEQEEVKVFPRLKEKDPYTLLGIPTDADFEEIQEARNYLYDLYKSHEPSKESIELAFDHILKAKIEDRQKHGFRPPQTGRRGDAKVIPKTNLLTKFLSLFERDIPTNTIINDSVAFLGFLAFGILTITLAEYDPTIPIIAALCYSIWRIMAKRRRRNPEGPFLGGSPFFMALVTSIICAAIGTLVGVTIAAPFQTIGVVDKPIITETVSVILGMGVGTLVLR